MNSIHNLSPVNVLFNDLLVGQNGLLQVPVGPALLSQDIVGLPPAKQGPGGGTVRVARLQDGLELLQCQLIANT